MRGRLEREIRLLPQVLSCSFSQDDYVVVLIDPSADPWTIQLAVERILTNAGSSATVRLIGPPAIADTASRRAVSPFVATAAVASIAAVGVGALVGGLTAIEHPKLEVPQKPDVVAAALAPLDTLDAFRGFQITIGSRSATASRLISTETPGLSSVLPVSFGTAAEAVSLPKAMPKVRDIPKADLDEVISVLWNRRGAPRALHGRHLGNGPRPWSQSVLLPPHPHGDVGPDH
jgi:hypothetical protein